MDRIQGEKLIKNFLEKEPKYNNKKITIDGIKFDSTMEGNRYCELKILEKIGEIKNLTCHMRFNLEAGITFKPDFIYDQDNKTIVEDFKGCITDSYKVRRKLFIHKFVANGPYSKYLESYKDGTIKEIKPPRAKKQ